MKKIFSAFLLALMLVGLILAPNFGKVSAESAIPKPSAPEFTLKLVDHSYDMPSNYTYQIDQYTGKEVRTGRAGYRVENKTVEITIKNQPYTYSSNGVAYNLYYNVRVKGHFGNDWSELYPIVDRLCSDYKDEYSNFLSRTSPPQSTSEYTVLSFSAANYPADSQIDVQVQAIIGHDSRYYVLEYAFLYPTGRGNWAPAVAYDITSDWSSTQTITLDWSTSASQSQSDAQSVIIQFGLDWKDICLFAALGVIAVLLAIIAFMRRKCTKPKAVFQ